MNLVGNSCVSSYINRDFLHIYFYRKDYKNFWNNVRPTLMSDTGIPKTHFSIHYDEPVDFNTIKC